MSVVESLWSILFIGCLHNISFTDLGVQSNSIVKLDKTSCMLYPASLSAVATFERYKWSASFCRFVLFGSCSVEDLSSIYNYNKPLVLWLSFPVDRFGVVVFVFVDNLIQLDSLVDIVLRSFA